MKWSTAYGLIWVSVAAAVSVAIFVTKSANPLWAMLIPEFVSVNSDDKE